MGRWANGQRLTLCDLWVFAPLYGTLYLYFVLINKHKLRWILKNSRSKEGFGYSTMTEKEEIQQWLAENMTSNNVFLSVHFGTPPESKEELCHRCKPIFSRLFRKILGREWYRHYKRDFTIIGFQEYGRHKNIHAHFILVAKRDAYNANKMILTLQTLSERLKMDIWGSKEQQLSRPKLYANDIMATEIYSDNITGYASKEITINGTRMSDTIILDADIFC